MKSIIRPLGLIMAFVFLLAGCSSPAASTKPTISSTQTTTSQSSTTSTTKPPTPTPTSPVPTIIVGTLSVQFIDVGQGDAVLIRHPAGINMLIDGGDTDTGIVQYLKDHGIKKLDIVVATHPHPDHIGGLVQVLKAIPVAKVVTNGQMHTTVTYERFLDAIAAAKAEYVEVKRGDTIRFGEMIFNVLNPVTNTGDDLNDNSIVLRMTYRNISFLFEGDAQINAEKIMSVSSFSPVQATILKVAHHGSKTSSSPAFLALVKPEVAIYSAGLGNDYGHPQPETIAALTAAGALIYGTDVNGSLIVSTDGKTFQITASKGELRAATIASTLPTKSPVPLMLAAALTFTPPGYTPTPSSTTSSPTVTSTTLTKPTGPGSGGIQPVTTTRPISLPLAGVSVSGPAKPGSQATFVARTVPGALCHIEVSHKSGASETIAFKGDKIADSNGYVSWTWTIDATASLGEWGVTVSVTTDGRTIGTGTAFEVTK